MWDFLAFVWRNKVIWKRSVKVALRDQMFNLHILVSMIIRVYIIDTVVGDKDASEQWLIKTKEGSLIAIVIFTIIILLPLHVVDYFRVKDWRIGGPTRLQLMSAILRRFLHFTSKVR